MSNYTKCPCCGGRLNKYVEHNGRNKWECECCRYTKYIESKNDEEQMYEIGECIDAVFYIVNGFSARDKSKRIQEWNEQKLKYGIDKYIEKYSGELGKDPLFAMVQIANLTYGFQTYDSKGFENTFDKAESLFVIAKDYLKKNPHASKLKELVNLYKKLRRKKRVNKTKTLVTTLTVLAVAIIVGIIAISTFSPTVSDLNSGISIYIPSGAVDNTQKLNLSVDVEEHPPHSVSYIDAKNALRNETEKFSLYDISLNSGANKANFNGSVTVSIPIPEGYDTGALKVYYVASDETYEELPAIISVANNTIRFDTTHFSLYAVAERYPIVNFDTVGNGEIERQIVKRDSLATAPDTPTRTGYTFAGWTLDGQKWDFSKDTVKKDITLVANWIPNTYEVALEANGGVGASNSLTVAYMSTYGKLPQLTKPGYTFVGWYTAAEYGTQVTAETIMNKLGNHTLYAMFTANTNTITFNANGGNGKMNDFSLKSGETAKLPVCTYTKPGHIFTGWSTTITGDVLYKDRAMYTMGNDANCTLYAQWEVSEHQWSEWTVTVPATCSAPGLKQRQCSTCGEIQGENISALEHEYDMQNIVWTWNNFDDAVVTLTCLNNANHIHKITVNVRAEITTPVTCTVQGAKTYTATVNIDGKTYTDKKTEAILAPGHKPIKLPAVDSTCEENGLTEGSICSVCREILVAQETIKPKGHIEAIDKGYAETCTEHGLTYGKHCLICNKVLLAQEIIPPKGHTEVIIPRVDPTYEEGGFEEGVKCSECRKVLVEPKPIPPLPPQNYSVIYKNIKGAVIPSEYLSYVEHTGLFLPENISVSEDNKGYEFDGWYTAANGGQKVTHIPQGTKGEYTVYAHWKTIEYTIIFESNGGSTIYEKKYNIESEKAVLTIPEKTGYIFCGWFDNEKCTGIPVEAVCTGTYGNKKFYAKWNKETYTIEFDTGCNIDIQNKEYTIETKTFNLPFLTRKGYTFAGWYENEYFFGQTAYIIKNGTVGNKKYYAKWEAKQYTITFATNGGTDVTKQTYDYGALTNEPTAPTKDGYDFLGWSFDGTDGFAFGNSMPDRNITATAMWDYKTVHYDSGDEEKRIDASHEYDYDTLDISSLSVFMKKGYKLEFSMSLLMREENEGYQEIYLRTSKGANVGGTGEFTHGGSGKDDWWGWNNFSFVIEAENCTPIMYLRYGAHGKGSDDWIRRWAVVTVSVIPE